ncbi:MAG: acylphosphatase [Dichotomicrobium sp.]
MAEHRTVHVLIEGRVQGVNFRGWACEQAEQLGLSGWIRNRRDGAVEALFAGPSEDVAAMLERCRSGPRHARVESIETIQEGGAAPTGGFAIVPSK